MTVQQWLAQNPLRQWRHRWCPSLSVGACARLLGVSETCIRFWEGGALAPSLSSLQLLQFHCGITFDEYEQWWRQGYECLETDETGPKPARKANQV
jgi:hypothetical protein